MDGTPAPVTGTLAELPGTDLLRALAHAGTSGLLKVGVTSPTWAAIAEGNVVVAGQSDGPGLGDVLRSSGVVDDASLVDAVSRAGTHDIALLHALTEQPGADVSELVPIVRDHTVGAVFRMILPSDDEFAFQAGAPLALARHFSFPVESILESAAERMREWAEVAQSIPSTDAVFRPRRRLDDDVDMVTVDRDEWSILAVLDGRRSVAQTIAATGRDTYAVCSTLHRLLEAGFIERLP